MTTQRTIEHDVKLESSAKIILAALAIGVMANAFAPCFAVKDVLAELQGGEKFKVKLSGDLKVKTPFLEALAKVVKRKNIELSFLKNFIIVFGENIVYNVLSPPR